MTLDHTALRALLDEVDLPLVVQPADEDHNPWVLTRTGHEMAECWDEHSAGRDARLIVAAVNALPALLDEREALLERIAALETLVVDLHDPDPCRFDHHGGCQAHGYLSLQPGETCPQADAQAIARALVTPEAPDTAPCSRACGHFGPCVPEARTASDDYNPLCRWCMDRKHTLDAERARPAADTLAALTNIIEEAEEVTIHQHGNPIRVLQSVVIDARNLRAALAAAPTLDDPVSRRHAAIPRAADPPAHPAAEAEAGA